MKLDEIEENYASTVLYDNWVTEKDSATSMTFTFIEF